LYVVHLLGEADDDQISALWGPVLKTEDPYLPPGKGMCCMSESSRGIMIARGA
jgi:hypothetical protein